jgi:D-alanyl-D-alanine carboxypeptidase/D-alanyl-D-alanine-endopeptidase (penicillin-binding protein 4)
MAGVALALALTPAQAAEASLEEIVGGFLRRLWFEHATWGVLVADADSGRALFATNAHSLLKPASNAKLFTAALALDRLGPDFRIRTDLIFGGDLTDEGTLRGDLVIFGRGDFSFAGRFHDGDSSRSLAPIARALQREGVRRIEGGLITDDSYFRGPPFGAGWTWDDLQYYYGAEVSALGTEDNVLDLVVHPGDSLGAPVTIEVAPPSNYLSFHMDGITTGPPDAPREVTLRRDPGTRIVVGTGTLPLNGPPWTDSVTVPEPALFFGARLKDYLNCEGIALAGGVRHLAGAAARLSKSRATARRLSIESPPLSELIVRMMKPSQNLYAQLLLLQVGAHEAQGSTDESTETAGLRALHAFLSQVGIPRDEVLLDDGSGLSRSGLVTPAAVVALLRLMDRHPTRGIFAASLPVAGVDGTLRRRFRRTAAEANLRAKTGTLRYVDALSGWVTNREGRRMVFSILLNGYTPAPGAPTGREAVDAVALRLAESGVKQANGP